MSGIVNPRQIAPSTARIIHLTGLKSLSFSIHSGITISGTMLPPSMASGIIDAQPAPATACSVRPRVLISIMKPVKPKREAEHRGGQRRPRPDLDAEDHPSATKSSVEPTQVVKQAIALPARIAHAGFGAMRSRP